MYRAALKLQKFLDNRFMTIDNNNPAVIRLCRCQRTFPSIGINRKQAAKSGSTWVNTKRASEGKLKVKLTLSC